MTAEKRNFWIVLTMIALTISAASMLDKRRSHRWKQPCHIKKFEKKSCEIRKKNCGNWNRDYVHREAHVLKSENADRYLIEKRRRRCKPHPKVNDFYLPEELPKVQNHAQVLQRINFRNSNLRGGLTARVLVDEWGNYAEHKIIRSDHPHLKYAVDKQIHRLTFTPARDRGEAVRAWVNVRFDFGNER